SKGASSTGLITEPLGVPIDGRSRPAVAGITHPEAVWAAHPCLRRHRRCRCVASTYQVTPVSTAPRFADCPRAPPVSNLSQRSSFMPVAAVDFQGGVTSPWSHVLPFVPNLAAALHIVRGGYLTAKVVTPLPNKVLERVGFDRAVERGGIKQALARSK